MSAASAASAAVPIGVFGSPSPTAVEDDPEEVAADFGFGKPHADRASYDAEQQKGLRKTQKCAIVRAMGKLARLTGCMLVLSMVTEKYHTSWYSTHGSFADALRFIADLTRFKKARSANRHLQSDAPKWQRRFSAAEAAAARFTLTVCVALDGVLRPALVDAVRRRALAMSEHLRTADDALLRRRLETVLAASANPDSAAALALAKALETAALDLLPGAGDAEAEDRAPRSDAEGEAGGSDGGSGSGDGSPWSDGGGGPPQPFIGKDGKPIQGEFESDDDEMGFGASGAGGARSDDSDDGGAAAGAGAAAAAAALSPPSAAASAASAAAAGAPSAPPPPPPEIMDMSPPAVAALRAKAVEGGQGSG